MNITTFAVTLLAATILCSLVAGFLFAFAAVVMPGIRNLDDGGFIRAFQVIDRIIQNNQPLFMLVWVGSVLALIAATVLGVRGLADVDRLLLMAALLIYILLVQLPTFVVNIPLNNALQQLNTGTATAAALERARAQFEPRWNRWNTIRAVCAAFVSIVLAVLLLRL